MRRVRMVQMADAAGSYYEVRLLVLGPDFDLLIGRVGRVPGAWYADPSPDVYRRWTLGDFPTRRAAVAALLATYDDTHPAAVSA